MTDDTVEGAPKTTRKTAKGTNKAKRTRRTILFPASSFEEALTIPNAIQKHAAGQKVRRLTLFDQMGKSPDSGPSRQLIVNANKYGLIKGSYSAEHLELTPDGKLATSSETSPKERLAARFKLAIEKIPPFKELYDAQKGNRLPASSILEDLAKEKGIPSEDAKECVEVFIVNAKFLGVLKPIAGAERIIPVEQALEEIPAAVVTPSRPELIEASTSRAAAALPAHPEKDHNWDAICFYISPIGDEGSEHRIHADLFLASLVEPGLEEFGLKVVRADKIGKPGMITAQVLEYILKSKLVIADLSFHNPNVFYELSLRHACRLPTVQVIRKCDKIPFDLDQFRTIQIDTTSIFTMVPNLQTYKAEIATQVRMALRDPDSVDNPISTYYPTLKVSF
ncbi:MAG: hypothetical protein ABSC15_05400 [Terriglobales bacterium]|jgi:hypothetical protein